MQQPTPSRPQPAPENPLRRYLDETRGPGYVLFLALPFAVFYEAGLAVFHRAGSKHPQIRNGADAILRALFFPHWLEGKGRAAVILWGGFGLIVLFAAIVLWHRDKRNWGVKPRFLAAAYGEAFSWALLLFVGWLLLLAVGLREIAEAPRQAVEGQVPLSAGLKVVLSCGAGVYEELLFRLMLVSALVLFLRGLIGMSRPGAVMTAVLAAAVLFAAVHYVGPFEDFGGDAVAYLRLGFRVSAGVFFSALLALRGFGVAVATHAFYDIIVTGVEVAVAAEGT